MVIARLISSPENFLTSDQIEITQKRNGYEDVVLIESDDRTWFENHIIDACDLLKDDQVVASEDMYLTIGIFGNSSDFSKSMVLSKNLLRRISVLNLTLEVNTYG